MILRTVECVYPNGAEKKTFDGILEVETQERGISGRYPMLVKNRQVSKPISGIETADPC